MRFFRHFFYALFFCMSGWAFHHECLEYIENDFDHLNACYCLIPLAKEGNLHARGYLLKLREMELCSFWQPSLKEIDVYEITQWPDAKASVEASTLLGEIKKPTEESKEPFYNKLKALYQSNVAHAIYLIAKHAELLDNLNLNKNTIQRTNKRGRARARKTIGRQKGSDCLSDKAKDNFIKAASLGHLSAIKELIDKYEWQASYNKDMQVSSEQISLSMHKGYEMPFNEQWQESKKKPNKYINSLHNVLQRIKFIKGNNEFDFISKLPLHKAKILLSEYLKNTQSGAQITGLVDYMGKNDHIFKDQDVVYLQNQALRKAVDRFLDEDAFTCLAEVNMFNFKNKWPSIIKPQSEEEFLRAKDWVLNQLLIIKHADSMKDFVKFVEKVLDKEQEHKNAKSAMEAFLEYFLKDFSESLKEEYTANKYVNELFHWLLERALKNHLIAKDMYLAFQAGITGFKDGYVVFLPILKSLVQRHQNDPSAWMSLGVHLERMNDTDGALEAFRHSWELGNPNGATSMANIFVRVGQKHLRRGEKEEQDLFFLLAQILFHAAHADGDERAQKFLKAILEPEEFVKDLVDVKAEDVCIDHISANYHGLHFIQAAGYVDANDHAGREQLLQKALFCFQFQLEHSENFWDKGHSHVFLSLCFMLLGNLSFFEDQLLQARIYWESWKIDEVFDHIWHFFKVGEDTQPIMADVDNHSETEEEIVVEEAVEEVSGQAIEEKDQIKDNPIILAEDPFLVVQRLFPYLSLNRSAIDNIQLLFDEKKMKNRKRTALLKKVSKALGGSLDETYRGSRRKMGSKGKHGYKYQDHGKGKNSDSSHSYQHTQLCEWLMKQGVVNELIKNGLLALPDKFKYLLNN